jgi:hypothetical protein
MHKPTETGRRNNQCKLMAPSRPPQNTLIPLQRAVTGADVAPPSGGQAPSTSKAVGATPSRPRCGLAVALAPVSAREFGFGTFAYANGSIAKVLSSDKDRASSPHDGLLKGNPPPSAIVRHAKRDTLLAKPRNGSNKHALYRERSEPAPGVAGMGLMDFEERGSQEPQANVTSKGLASPGTRDHDMRQEATSSIRGWLRRGRLTTRQRRKAQTLVLATPTKARRKK